MVEQKISIEKREAMAKRNILSALIPIVDTLANFNKEVTKIAKDAELSEDYLREWVKGEMESLGITSETLTDEDDDDDTDEEAIVAN